VLIITISALFASVAMWRIGLLAQRHSGRTTLDGQYQISGTSHEGLGFASTLANEDGITTVEHWANVSPEEATEILDEMSTANVTVMLQAVDPQVRQRLLQNMSHEQRHDVEEALLSERRINERTAFIMVVDAVEHNIREDTRNRITCWYDRCKEKKHAREQMPTMERHPDGSLLHSYAVQLSDVDDGGSKQDAERVQVAETARGTENSLRGEGTETSVQKSVSAMPNVSAVGVIRAEELNSLQELESRVMDISVRGAIRLLADLLSQARLRGHLGQKVDSWRNAERNEMPSALSHTSQVEPAKEHDESAHFGLTPTSARSFQSERAHNEDSSFLVGPSRLLSLSCSPSLSSTRPRLETGSAPLMQTEPSCHFCRGSDVTRSHADATQGVPTMPAFFTTESQSGATSVPGTVGISAALQLNILAEALELDEITSRLSPSKGAAPHSPIPGTIPAVAWSQAMQEQEDKSTCMIAGLTSAVAMIASGGSVEAAVNAAADAAIIAGASSANAAFVAAAGARAMAHGLGTVGAGVMSPTEQVTAQTRRQAYHQERLDDSVLSSEPTSIDVTNRLQELQDMIASQLAAIDNVGTRVTNNSASRELSLDLLVASDGTEGTAELLSPTSPLVDSMYYVYNKTASR